MDSDRRKTLLYDHPKTKHVMADHARIEELIVKKLLGEITMEEETELQTLGNTSEENRELIDCMSPQAFGARLHDLRHIDDKKLDRAMKAKMRHIPGVLDWVTETTWIQRAARPACIVAAAALLIFGFAWWFFYNGARNGEMALNYPIEATLSWQQHTINLRSIPDGLSYKTGAIYIARLGNQIFINRRVDTTIADADAIEYQVNNISGLGAIQLFIQDSARTQIYPGSGVAFHIYEPGIPLKQKEMDSYGRVLFAVLRDFNTPFVVKTPKQEVAVLGTVFEVRDDNKENTRSVLCYSGSVQVRDPGIPPQKLKADQRLTVDATHTFKVSTGGFPKMPQWSSKERPFDFSDMNLDSAMTEIAHWYALSRVEFDPTIDRKRTGTVFSGKLSRYLTLQRLLSILERNDLHFQIRGQTLLVTK
jgi:hypothetical protein